MVMQMSHQWVQDRIKKDFFAYKTAMESSPTGKNYSRHVFLITPIQAAEHTIAITKIMTEGLVSNPAGAQKYAADHAKHDIEKEFGESDLDVAEQKYKTDGKYKRPPKKK
jgi:hypothetical protein